jgi:hypothetical protein
MWTLCRVSRHETGGSLRAGPRGDYHLAEFGAEHLIGKHSNQVRLCLLPGTQHSKITLRS